MVTTYNSTDMVKFGQFCIDLKEKGMLFPDEKISKQHFENWKVGLNSQKTFFCPKVQEIAHALMSKGVLIEMDEHENVLKNSLNIDEEARNNKVVIVSYNLGESLLSFQGSRRLILKMNSFLELSYNYEEVPFIKCDFPHIQFPVFKNGFIESIGICLHENDLFPNIVNSK